MNGDFIRYRGLIAVAVGAGVMIGAAGVFLYQQYFCERRRLLLQNDINQLGLSVAEIRRELNALRDQRKKSRNHRVLGGAPSVTTTDIDTEMFSTVGGDEVDVDDEFYDLSSDNETVVDESKEPGVEQDSNYDEIDTLLEGTSRQDKTKAYGLLLELLEKKEDDEEVLWRLAKACHMMASMYGAEGDKDQKKEFVFKGVEYGKKALEINSVSWKAHKWFAICVGARGELQSVKDKLKDGHMFKEHVDTAIKINPQDATLHHLMGRFYYEVASLPWMHRKVANTLFGEVPAGTYKEAIQSLLEAEKLNDKPWKENRLLLAKAYLAEQAFQEGLRWLDLAKEIPAHNAERVGISNHSSESYPEEFDTSFIESNQFDKTVDSDMASGSLGESDISSKGVEFELLNAEEEYAMTSTFGYILQFLRKLFSTLVSPLLPYQDRLVDKEVDGLLQKYNSYRALNS